MKHRKWHEWFGALESCLTITYGDGSYKEVDNYLCLCGHEWLIETEYNVDGFKESKNRRDYQYIHTPKETE